jgi:hypothetical protein
MVFKFRDESAQTPFQILAIADAGKRIGPRSASKLAYLPAEGERLRGGAEGFHGANDVSARVAYR